MSPILGIWASAQQLAFAGNYDSIATVTVGSSGQSTVEFTSIPSTYKHLQLRTFTNNASNLQLSLQFNNDSGNNYSWHALYGDGSTTGALAGSSNGSITNITYASTSANIYFAGVIDILDYANTNKYKTVKSLTGWDTNGGGSIHLRSGLWQSTSAISSLKFTTLAGNLTQYTQFALYGIK